MVLIKKTTLKSPAKINLHLRVLKKTKNKFHLIESLVSLIGLYDEITIIETMAKKTKVSFSGKFSKRISSRDNLIVNTIALLQNRNKKIRNKNFIIKVKKNIPVGSGLGGGSSNAVTVLLFLIKKFNLKVEKKIILEILNKIGFDSRIFLDKYPKFISHYGEKVNIFKHKLRMNVLLIYPNKPNFTKTIYRKNRSFSKTISIKKTQQIIKKNIHKYFHTANNDLIDAAKKINPRIGHLIEYLKKQKMCDFVQMTGSGSCCFAIFKSKKNLLKCEKLVKTHYKSYWTAKTKTIPQLHILGLSQAVRQRFLIPPSQVRSLEPQPFCMLNIISDIPEAVKIYKLLNPFGGEKHTSTKFVGGCVRDLILGNKIKDIDLATNFSPQEVIKILETKNIKTNNKAINFGVITAYINNYSFEITTLRKDFLQDGRYAKIEFTQDWKLDSQRRDFTINAIYCKLNTECSEGFQLFDPHNGREDLMSGKIKFVKNAKISINEDYVRALRYFRFFYSYSNYEHDPYVLTQIFENKDNIKNLSQKRLETELKKIITINPKLKIEKNSLVKDFFSYIYSDFATL